MTEMTVHPWRLAGQRRLVALRGWLIGDLVAAFAAAGEALGKGLAHILLVLVTAYLLHRMFPDVPLALP